MNPRPGLDHLSLSALTKIQAACFCFKAVLISTDERLTVICTCGKENGCKWCKRSRLKAFYTLNLLGESKSSEDNQGSSGTKGSAQLEFSLMEFSSLRPVNWTLYITGRERESRISKFIESMKKAGDCSVQECAHRPRRPNTTRNHSGRKY